MSIHAPEYAEKSAAAADREIPLIRRSVEQLDKALSDLDMTFASLADRLQSVLGPESDERAIPHSDPSPPCSDLATKLGGLIYQVARLADRMKDVGSRVEC